LLPADTDEKIIVLLSQTADLTYREMAGKLGLNESTVRKRVIGLRRRGVIRRFLADVDPEKLGYRSRVVLGVDADPSKVMSIGKRLAALSETRTVFNTSGAHDFHVVVWTRDRESLTKIIDKVSAMDGVTRVTTSFMVERLK